jgi:hypothetical protein
MADKMAAMRNLPQLIRRLRYGAPVIVVSGLPRSGTSMAMRMLQAGGVPILADDRRVADGGNPYGYFEFEPVKQLDKTGGNVLWLPKARGHAVKIISFLLTWLPETYDYQVVFMERELDEIVASQKKLLALRDEAVQTDTDEMTKNVFRTHLEQVRRLLAVRRCFGTLSVKYRDVIDQPSVQARRIARFVGAPLDTDRMAAAIDRGLYRTRAPRSTDAHRSM